METLLQIEDLSISFRQEKDRLTVLQPLSFSLQARQTTALVGESGSGKSLTSLAIMGLLPREAMAEGRILYQAANGEQADLLKLPEKHKRLLRGKDIGMIFQEPMSALNPLMTCGAQLMEAIQVHQKLSGNALREAATKWFEKVELPEPSSMLHRYPHELSGGQQQRVMIAMAVCNHPRILIADEPTTALDVRVQQSILELLARLQEEFGMALLLVTHDLGVVADVAQQVVVLRKGQLVEKGPVETVILKPGHPYTKALMQCRPAMHKPGEPLPVIPSDMELPEKNIGQETFKTVTTETPDIKMPLLEVKNLGVTYTKQHKKMTALEDISFSLPEGELLGIVGESGSGKSSLGKAILGLVKPSSGTVLYLGQPLDKIRSRRRELQVVFQDPYGSLNPRLAVGDALTEPMLFHRLVPDGRTAKKKAENLFRAVDLDSGTLNRYPHQFSGGQRQRICIARALACEPRVMIFDESVSALDPSVQAQVLNLIRDLQQKQGLTGLFISHDLTVVRYLCRRVMILQAGKLIEQGETEQVFQQPQNPYTRALLDAIPGSKKGFNLLS